ncbi:ArsR/SmtB family transcription factor [Pelagibacterium xiamenense]|uniref:ArsR/SmtB family transcription factor n=1 Tax=Pelagibacterium xiamenense TaxID=2901140 RepID=UPI001E52D74B|nr:metalloregulator ArsR/SmtB family transcription factor [Pelagibacterium xiamenense]MCD7060148.1 metalloregulator ArsR/SmtB family transcription factor [Pelagibacterium xiamenense]
MLKAAGEATRLRLIALLAEGELSVKDFTEILDQSQPRISRHLKLLADANLVSRYAEGAWAYYRLCESGPGSAFADWLKTQIDRNAQQLRQDREKLDAVRKARREEAEEFFATIAGSWDKLRSLHAPDSAVEAEILSLFDGIKVDTLLDLGTGTGRMLELLAGHYRQGIGIDSSREMLRVARSKLEAEGISNGQVRLGDIGALEDFAGAADRVVLHQVLHYFDDPGAAVSSAARCLRAEGQMIVVDFAPHEMEFLRDEQAHRRLGLSDAQMGNWAQAAGLSVASRKAIPPETEIGLTVCLWVLEHAETTGQHA